MGEIVSFPPELSNERIEILLQGKIDSNVEFLEEVLQLMRDTQDQTKEDNEPDNFVYGKLLRYLKEGITDSQIINLCAASLWALFLERQDIDSTE